MEREALLLHGGRIQADPAERPIHAGLLIGSDGRIARVVHAGEPKPEVRTIDLAGKLIVPGLIDAHQHLDKSRTLDDVDNPAGTLDGAVAASSAYAKHMTRDTILPRAERTLRACVAHGTVAIRSHANIDAALGLRSVEALIELRERWQDRLRLQVVAFLSSSAPNDPRAVGWLDACLASGADVIGGTPARAHDPNAFLDLLFAAAERTGRPIDLHLDEHLDPGAVHFDAVIERTRALGLQGRVVASHCCALSALESGEAHRIIDGFAAAGIGVITLPAANLFLQGRDNDRLTPRGLTRVNTLAAAGVTVACASDNIRDPFVPTGSGDLLEIARWTLLAGHLGTRELPRAFNMATVNPARLLGIDADYGIRAGARADLLITDAEDAADLVAGGALSRIVLFGGQVVAGAL
ncbi:MAG: amidohydrolase family protein [Burkholderiales bacterium]